MTSGLTSLLSTAKDALSAQSYGVTVAGQNITNVNTPNYARREAILETRALGAESYGGVNVQGLRRITDIHLERSQLASVGNYSAASTRDQVLGKVEALFNDAEGSGLGTKIDQLFDSFTALSARPDDSTTRTAVLESAGELSSAVRGVADELASMREQLLSQARETAEAVNSRAQLVADLNRRIHNAEVQGQDAADLRDQRSQVLLDLSQYVNIRTANDGSGTMIVQAAGTVLVEGSNARQLSIDLDGSGQIQVLADRAGGGGPHDITQHLTGGTLAGIKEARDVDLFETSQQLDELVFDLANSINAQHALGFGADGVSGRQLFEVSATAQDAARSLTVSADVAGNPEAIAASGSLATLPGGADNAVALAALGEAALPSSGRSASQSYADLVGSVGERKASAERSEEMLGAIHSQTQAMREAMSGVSLDEEMVSLMKFQRAYDASAQVLSVVDEMLRELIATAR